MSLKTTNFPNQSSLTNQFVRTTMTPKHFTLIPTLHPHKLAVLENPKTGHISYMGQILKQLGQTNLMNKDGKPCLLLSDIHKMSDYPPFTIRCKHLIIQSDLTTLIINTPPENCGRVAMLLEQAGFTCTFTN